MKTQPRRRVGPATVAVLVALALFVVLWGPVLLGRRTLVGSDVLYSYRPWSSQPAARPPRNTYVGDPVTQFVPWLGLVRHALGGGELPLWNPFSLGGTPLLADDQSSPFSPFTLFAMLFRPLRGISMAMLLKLWVAGWGMALFTRVNGCRRLAAVVAGIAYATSSFVVVWLGYPHASVAALLPWVFAAVAWCLRDRHPLAPAAIALAVALQFLAGHAETSLHLGVAMAVYLAVRMAGLKERRLRAVLVIATAGALGTLVAGVQLVPFVSNLSQSSLVSDRAHSSAGSAHLSREALSTWVVPNGKGSPGIDGTANRYPVYPESVGYAGVGALVLAAFALWRVRRRSWEKLSLLTSGLVAGAVVYGPLSAIAGRAPLLALSNNIRLLVVLCFVVAALAGLGLDDLLEEPRAVRRALRGVAVSAAGALLIGLGASVVVMLIRPHDLRTLLPTVDQFFGFWLLAGGLAAAAAVGLLAARRAGAGATLVGSGFVALALVEAVLFAYPYNPRVPNADVPSADPTIAWLRQNAGDGHVAAVGLDLIPDLSVSSSLLDVRGVDTVINRRVREYWSRADPAYSDVFLYTMLGRPDARWLAAAGVTQVVTAADRVLPGTEPVHVQKDVAVSRVPAARPFAFAAASAVAVRDAAEAGRIMAADPLGPVAVEAPPAAVPEPSGPAAPTEVAVVSRRPQSVVLDVEATSPTTVVVLQSYSPGWVARVDGRKTAVRAADILFQSVDVPAGPHRVTLRYEPASLRLGLVATAAGLLGVAVLTLLTSGGGRRRAPGRSG